MAGVIAERYEGPGLLQRVGQGLLRYSLIIGLFVLWDVLVRTGAYTPFMLPSPWRVLQYIWDDAIGGSLDRKSTRLNSSH